MLDNSDVIVSLGSLEDKEAFIKWFKERGFDDFIKNSDTYITCIASDEIGELATDEEYQDDGYGIIELQ